MIYRLLLGLWLVIAWVAMWRDISAANIVSGVIVAAAVITLFPPPTDQERLRIRPWPLLRFLGAALLAIIRANVVVAWEVLTPANKINEGIVTVELTSDHPVVITLISHAIGLAPGTMVVDIELGVDANAAGDDIAEPTLLYVHVLHLREIADVHAEVLELERLAVAAVCGQDDIDSSRKGNA